MMTRFAFIVCLLLLLCPTTSHGEVWNLLMDFSATENPNGAWSFGWRPSATEPLVLYSDILHDTGCPPDPDVTCWNFELYSLALNVSKNSNNHVWSCNGCDYPANTVWFHPGPTQQSVVRWTAPGEMRVALTADFRALDTGASVVRVYYNGTELFSETLPNIGATAHYSSTTTCHTGDIIDIAVDAISHVDDSVQLDVIIEPPVGACCFPSGGCLVGEQTICEEAGGTYMGDEAPCDPNPCESTPIEATTWGRVKAIYR